MSSKLLATLVGLSMTLVSQAAYAAEYIVKIKQSRASKEFLETAKTLRGVAIRDRHAIGNLVTIELGSDRASLEKLAELYKDASIEYVIPNTKMHMFSAPNDPEYSQQWALPKVNAEAAWSFNVGTREVVIAVIDTGVDAKHADLAANIHVNAGEIAGNNLDDDGNGFIDDVNGWDFRDNDADPTDITSDKNPGHGTHCAGIIGAVGNNNKGITGINQSVSIMPIRFIGADGSGDLMSAVKAIDYAIDNGARVISASWGAAVPREQAASLLEAIQRAEAKGVIFVAAAANDGTNNDTREVYPANAGFDNTIAVAASQRDDTKPSWSNYGKATVHLASPGHEIYSTIPGDKYRNLSGTSMATPLVAGITALLLGSTTDESLDGLTIRSLLQSTGQAVAIETACNCRVDVGAAMAALNDRQLTIVPAAFTVAPQGTRAFKGFGGKAPYTFTVANAQIATITSSGTLTGVAEGQTTVTMTDANGVSRTSLPIYVAQKQQNNNLCPLQDPSQCAILCMIDPTLPWCQ